MKLPNHSRLWKFVSPLFLVNIFGIFLLLIAKTFELSLAIPPGVMNLVILLGILNGFYMGIKNYLREKDEENNRSVVLFLFQAPDSSLLSAIKEERSLIMK